MNAMREAIAAIITKAISAGVTPDITVPERAEFGHYATNVALRLAKEVKRNPLDLAKELAEKIAAAAPVGFFEKVEAAPPGFVNFWLSKETVQREFARIAEMGGKFGESEAGKGKTAIVEYASLNIAKPFHIGYLRNIAIGDALAKLHAALGYKVIRWNYLGDWGTQFGKLVTAYRLWGDRRRIEQDPITELLALYVKFHAEAKDHPELEDRAREEFRKIEEGDAENRTLWEWFKKESLAEFGKTLRKLDVAFDIDIGESFFEKEMKPTVQDLLDRGIATRSEGAVIVPLDEFGLPPAMAAKSDGGSLYLTRDLANLRYRMATYHPAKVLYVVGNEQALHFEQVFRVAEKMGLGSGAELAHIKFGLVFAERGKKLSTREGNIVLLEDVIAKAEGLVERLVDEKNPSLAAGEKKKIVAQVAIGALKYSNLRENRNSDVIFDWDEMLNFSGDSGPYLQYTHARLESIRRKAGAIGSGDVALLGDDDELGLIRAMAEFPEAVRTAGETYAPNHLALYLYELANLANRYYEATPILKDEDVKRRDARLALIGTVAGVLKRGLGLLGIEAPEKI